MADKVAAGPWSQVNAELIPAQNPGSVCGAVYEVLDTAVMPNTLIAYYLEDVDIHGASTFHGPISINFVCARCGNGAWLCRTRCFELESVGVVEYCSQPRPRNWPAFARSQP